MAERASWLVIGAGAAGSIHVRQLLARGYAVTVADADPARAQALAQATGATAGDLEGEFRGAVIATPANTRLPLVERALQLAEVLVCEKPLALAAEDAQAIAGMAPGRIYIAESQCYGGADGLDVRRMADRIDAGEFGRPVIWRVRAMTKYRPQAWCQDLSVGGGAFMEGGVHMLTTARVLFGEAVKWQGSVRSFAGGTGPDTGTFIIDYEHGDCLTLDLAWGSESCFTGQCAPFASACGIVGPVRCEAWWSPDDHAAMWEHLSRCLRGGAEPVATVDHAAGAVADVWRCYAAAGIVEPEGAGARASHARG